MVPFLSICLYNCLGQYDVQSSLNIELKIPRKNLIPVIEQCDFDVIGHSRVSYAHIALFIPRFDYLLILTKLILIKL